MSSNFRETKDHLDILRYAYKPHRWLKVKERLTIADVMKNAYAILLAQYKQVGTERQTVVKTLWQKILITFNFLVRRVHKIFWFSYIPVYLNLYLVPEYILS